jgi:outer membrane lipoprotein-sorting protein
MLMRVFLTFLVVCVYLAALLPPAAGHGQSPSLEQVAANQVRDLTAQVTTIQVAPAELEKINRDFATLYRLRDITLQYKDPHKLRVENRLGLYVVNGAARRIRVPALGINRRDDLGAAVGRRPTLLDVGLLTRATMPEIEGKYLRTERLQDREMWVFEITYKNDASLKYICWIDPQTRVIMRRDWLDSGGNLRARFLMHDVKEVEPGLWLPTRMEVRTSADTVAGVVAYSSYRINTDLDESLFNVGA